MVEPVKQKVFNFSATTLNLSFLALFALVPLAMAPFTSELFEFNKMIATYFVTTVVATSWVARSIVQNHFIFKRTPLDIPIALFLLSQLLSTIFSINPHTSIWGYYSRFHGGLASTISYTILFYAFVANVKQEQVKIYLKALASSAALVSVWGVAEHFGVDAQYWVQDVRNRVFSTLGQPNWLAAWLVALIPITWAQILNHKLQSKTFWFWTTLSSLFFLTLLYTKSRSGLLGFAVASVVFWGIVAWKNKRDFSSLSRPFFVANSLLIILALAVGTPWSPTAGELISSQKVERQSEKPEVGTALEGGVTESADIRKVVWQGAVDAWRANPILGTGVETFAYAYYNFRPVEHNQTSEWEFLYNKAHNEYLNFLATTGILGLGTYLLLIGATIWLFLRILSTRYSLLSVALLAGYSSILVTNFFGFSVVTVALQFFLYPAMALAKDNSESDPEVKSEDLASYQKVFLFSTLALAALILLNIARFWYADILYARADRLLKVGQTVPAAEASGKAIKHHPQEPNYYDRHAQILSRIAVALTQENEATEAAKVAALAATSSDKAFQLNSVHLSLLKSRATTFVRLALVNPSYLPVALSALERAYKLAPTDPKIAFNLGVLYDSVGNKEKAEELLTLAVKLKPDYGDARLGLADFYFENEATSSSVEQVEYVLDNIFPEDKGIQEKLEEYKKAL